MIYSAQAIMDSLSGYKSPKCRLARLAQKGVYHKICRGLYETDKNASGNFLAASIYGPSYLSFEWALAFCGIIPERAEVFTSATIRKNRTKVFQTDFGTFSYRDVPPKAYPHCIRLIQEEEYSWLVASPEKALCDQLYKIRPALNKAELEEIIFENLRIDESDFERLNKDDLKFLCPLYHKKNLDLLLKLLGE